MEIQKSTKPKFQILSLFFIVLTVAHLDKCALLTSIGVIFLCFQSLLNDKWLNSWKLWALIAALYIYTVSINLETAANHAFLSCYVAIAASLCIIIKGASFSLNARLLLVILLFFATLQKFCSTYYMSGSLIADYIMKGDYSLKWFLTQTDQTFVSLQEQSANSYMKVRSVCSSQIWLPAYASAKIITLSKFLAWSGLIFEGLATIVCCNKKLLNSIIGFLTAIGLLLGIYLLRNETEFLALICVLFYYATSDKKIIYKRCYVAFFLYFATVTIAEYRPFFIS